MVGSLCRIMKQAGRALIYDGGHDNLSNHATCGN